MKLHFETQESEALAKNQRSKVLEESPSLTKYDERQFRF